MPPDSTVSFRELARSHGAFVPRLSFGFVCGSPFHGLPHLTLAGADCVQVMRGTETVVHRTTHGLHVEVADRWASSPHLEIRRQNDEWLISDSGTKNGCYVNGARIQTRALRDGDVIELGTTFLVYRQIVQRPDLSSKSQDTDVPASNSQGLQAIYQELRSVAVSDLPLLITGSTGTGKEVAAAFAHRCSARVGPFYPVNCAAIPATVSESFLFGHKKGAFSNAISDHGGVIRAAEAGTLFLDEVAELDLQVQAKLLRVLQEGSVTPIGGTRAIPVNVRVVCATHANLDELVNQGRFRQDLLARLSGHRAHLLSLAERREDLGLLTTELLLRRTQHQTRQIIFDRAALRAIYAYAWPNNVRELDQVLHRCALQTNLVVTADHLPLEIRDAEFAPERESLLSGDGISLENLTELLKKHNGNVSQIARELGKARIQIRRWCRRFGLDAASFRDDKPQS